MLNYCQGWPQLASPLMMMKGFEVLDGVMVDCYLKPRVNMWPQPAKQKAIGNRPSLTELIRLRGVSKGMCQSHSSLCKYTSGAMSMLGYRHLTYSQNSSELPFLLNKLQALVAKQRGNWTGGGAERVLQVVNRSEERRVGKECVP